MEERVGWEYIKVGAALLEEGERTCERCKRERGLLDNQQVDMGMCLNMLRQRIIN